MNAAALLRPLLTIVIALQVLNLIREQGIGMTLGTLLLGVVVGRTVVPVARARPLLATLIYSANATVAFVNLLVRTPSMDLMTLVSNVVLLLLVLDDPWVGWGRKLSARLKKAGFRFTRPVITPPA
ncbi:hypothetical protein [Deinococcus aluminii]|uniref:Uncharacterized protein n=1 Tax=Deinococcus aluminii TaxID=1656885 RepID=A0ABP9XB94_9DEIO